MDTLLLGIQGGAQYALLAAALVIVFNATGIVNFAIGSFAVAGVYAAIELDSRGAPAPVSIIGACIVVALLSVAMELLVSRPISRRFPRDGREIVLIATLLVFVVIQRIITLVWGSAPRAFPNALTTEGTVTIFGTAVTRVALTTFGVVAVLLLFSYILLMRSRAGLIVRAIAENHRAIGILGVNAHRYIVLTWAYAGLLAAAAGLLLANTVTPTPEMSSTVFIKAVAGAALGGVTSPSGAALGAVVVGLVEAYTAVRIDTGIASTLPMVVIFAVLIFRPSGLFGRPETVRV